MEIHSLYIVWKKIIHRIGWWQNLQKTPIFDGKNHGFRFRFSLQPIYWLIIYVNNASFFLKAETLFQGETEIGILPLKWDEHGVKTPGEIAKALALLSALFEQWKSHRNPWWNIGKSHRNIGKSHFKSFEKGGFFIASLVIITGHIRTPFLGCAAKLVNVFFSLVKPSYLCLSLLKPQFSYHQKTCISPIIEPTFQHFAQNVWFLFSPLVDEPFGSCQVFCGSLQVSDASKRCTA